MEIVMGRKTRRAKLILTIEQQTKLNQLSQSRRASIREVQRAKILMHNTDEKPISQIQKLVNVSRPTIYKCIDKAIDAKTTIWRILSANEIRPYKVRYYLERMDPDFEQKMQEILLVYQDANFQNNQKAIDD